MLSVEVLVLKTWDTVNIMLTFVMQKCQTHYVKRLQNILTGIPVVTICTAQWSLYVPHSGHCMYRTVITICTAQWSLYVPHSDHYICRQVFNISTIPRSTPHRVFMCFVWISEKTAIISLYSINWLVFITETECLLRGTEWVFKYRWGDVSL
jgi:hypothetical protein